MSVHNRMAVQRKDKNMATQKAPMSSRRAYSIWLALTGLSLILIGANSVFLDGYTSVALAAIALSLTSFVFLFRGDALARREAAEARGAKARVAEARYQAALVEWEANN